MSCDENERLDEMWCERAMDKYFEGDQDEKLEILYGRFHRMPNEYMDKLWRFVADCMEDAFKAGVVAERNREQGAPLDGY